MSSWRYVVLRPTTTLSVDGSTEATYELRVDPGPDPRWPSALIRGASLVPTLELKNVAVVSINTPPRGELLIGPMPFVLFHMGRSIGLRDVATIRMRGPAELANSALVLVVEHGRTGA